MKRFTPLGLALSLALAYPPAGALPQGAQVVQGQVVINPGLIQQASDKAIVNWQGFSIAAGETLRVQQPGVNSVLLNRVVGGDPSLILGQLQANGRVFLVNPRGIVFGRGSQVDVGGLVASTLDLSDTDFLAGIYRFSAGAQAGALQADGRITATGGTVALVAPQLSVAGDITARRVGLAAASTVQVDVEGDGLVLFNLRNDDDRDVALKVSGRVLAEGGSAELRAQARAGAAGQVLNMDGLVQARGLRQQGGRIVIDGGTAGITSVAGSVDATGEQGGSVTLLGHKLALLDGARVDASGRLGGGSLQVGGGFEGQGTAHNAERTWIGAGATLRADATETGDGGRIAVWADGRTDMLGRISARGGASGGNGGLVETSGRLQLNLLGSVDASAPQGRPGQWLLDPNDVVIKANGGSNANVGAAPDFTTTDDAAIVDVGALNTALTGGTTVTVQTLSAGTNAQAGNIDVQAAIVPTGVATLKLLAEGSILFSSGSIGAGGGALNVELDAKGSITGTTFNTGTGNLKATALGAINLGSVTVNDLTINGGAGTVTLPSGTVGNDLVVTTAGSIGQSGALAVTRDATLTTTGAAAVTLGSFGSRALTVATAGGTVTLGTGNLTGALDVDSGGGMITQASGGLTVSGTAALKAGVGDINLTEANNDLQGVVALTGATAHINSSKTASSLLQLGSGTLTGDLVATTAGGAITQTGTLGVGGAATLNAGNGAVTLAGFGSHGLTVRSTGGTVKLGTGTITGALDVDSGGGQIQQVAGGFTVTGTSALNAGTGAITLTEANDLQDTVTLTGAATSIASSKTAASVLKLGASTLSGNFSAVTGGGAIVQTGLLSVTGTASFDAGSGDITLAGLSTGALSAISTAGNIVLGHGTVASLSASTSSNGAITQAAGTLNVTGSATVTGGGGGAVLGSFNSAGLDVSATSGDVTLGTGSITGPLNVTTGAGSIGQSGALSVTGDATMSSLLGDITLASLSATGLLSLNAGGSALTLPTGSVGTTLTASIGGTGSITQAAGSLTVGGLATLSAGSGGMTLGSLDAHGLDATANNGGIQLGTGTLTGVLTVDSGGAAITQAAGSLSVTGNATLAAGAGSVTLGSFGSGGNVGITSTAGSITLGAGSITGTLTASTAGTGAITQAGALTVGGLASLTAGSGGLTLGSFDSHGLTANASNSAIVLGAGTITGALSATTTGSGAISQAGALTVTSNASLSTGSGPITLGTANITGTLTASTGGAGSITQTGSGVTAGGLATLSAGTGGVSLTQLDSAGLSITAAGGGVRLGTGTITGNLGVTSGGTLIDQVAGGLTVTGTSTLNAGAGAITLSAANDLQDSVTLTGAATSIASKKTAASVLKLGSSTISSTLVATTAGGDITQTGTLNVTGSATLNAGAGAITLAGLSTGQLDLTSTAGNLTLGSGTVAGLSASTGGSGAISQAAGSLGMAGAATLTTASGDITLGSFSSGGFSATTGGGAVRLGTGTVTGTLGVTTAGGAVTQAAGGLTVTSTSSLNAGAGDITLDQANNLTGGVTLTGRIAQLTNGGTHALTLTSATTSGALSLTTGGGDIAIGTGSVTGALNASSGGGAITQTGALSVTSLATLNAGAGSIALDGLANGGLNATTAGGTLTLGTGTINGTLTAATGGGVIDQIAGGFIVTGAASLNAGSAAITLAKAGNDWRGTVTLTGGTTQVSSTRNATTTLTLGTLNTGNLTVSTAGGALNLGQGSVSGTLDATTAGGTITQTGALSVSGIATLDATTAGDITLANTSNQWHGLNLTGNALDLRSNGDLEILSLTQPANRALTLSAGADLILGPAANIDTGTADLTLASLGGVFTVGGVLKGKNVDLQAHSGISLSKNLTATGNLKLTTASGGITQSTGIVAVTGTTTVDAGSTTIALAGASNDFGGAVSLSGGTTSLNDLNALTLGTLATGALTVTSNGALDLGKGTVNGLLNANSHGGTITQATGAGSGLTLKGATTILNAGNADITLTETGNDLQGAITATGGGVSLYSSGNLNLFALTQPANQALVLEALGTLTLPGGTTNIDTGTAALTLSSGGVFATFGTLKGGNVTLKGQSATLDHDITASGNLDLRTTTGTINQRNGRISVTGTSLFNAATFGITVNRSLNSFGGAVSLAGATAGIRGQGNLTLATMAVSSLTAQAGNGLQLGTGTLSGSLTATAGGAITQAAGGLRVGGTSSFSGSGGVTLLEATNAWTGAVSLGGGATQLLGTGAITLGGGNVSSLALTSGGLVSQSGALTVGGALTVNAGSAGITLDNGGNQLGGTVTLTGGATRISTGGALSLGTLSVGALTLESSGNLSLGQGTVGGNLDANSGGGAVTQSGLLNVSGSASIQAGSGSITLTQGGNLWGGALSLGGGTAQVTSNGGLTLGTLGLASLLVDATGTLNLGQGSVSGTLTANSHGGNLTQAGALDVGGAASLQAGGGAITLTQGANRWGGAVQLTGGATQISGSGALTLGTLATGNLNATSTGALNLGQGVINGNLVANSSGQVTQAGPLQVTGDTTINASGADITLANTGNRFLGAMNLSGNAVTLFNQPSLALGTLAFNSLDATSDASITLGSGSLTGALKAKALGGTITQVAGGLSVAGASTLQATGGITLTDAANHFQGKVSLAGGTTALTNAGALSLGSVATGALTLRAGGALDLGAGSIVGNLAAISTGPLTQTGALSVTGSSTLDAGSAAITLSQAGNALAGAVSLRGGNALLTNGGALTLASLAVGDLTVQSSGPLQLGTGTVGGTLKAVSGGAAITQAAGGLAVGGASTLDAGSASVQLADAANTFTGPISLNAGNATLASSTALTLGSFTTRDLSLSAGGDLDLGTGSASGNLTASTRGSRISQTGVLTVQGSSTFIADGSLVDLVLDQPANQLLGPIQMLGVNGGSFISANFSSALDLSFTGDVQTLTLSSGGKLTLGGGHSTTLTAAARNGIAQTGALDVSGATTLIARGGAAMLVDLNHAGNDFRDVTLRSEAGGSFGRVQLRDGDASRRDGLRIGGDAAALELASAGALDLRGGSYGSLAIDTSATGAAISQSGALTVTGAATLKAGGGSITLDRADNDWGGLVQLGGGTVQIRSSSALTLGTIATGDLTVNAAGAIDLGRGMVGGDLLASGGAITQSGALQLDGNATLNAGGADVTLANAGNRLLGTLSVTARDATLFSQPGLSLGMLALRNLDASSDGSVQLGTGSLTGSLKALGGTITQVAGGLSVAGASTLQASGGITLTDAANHFQGKVSLAGGTTALTNAGALILGSGSIAGNLAVKSTGPITQTDALSVTGSSTLDAGSAAITLSQAGNALAGAVSLRGGNALLTNGGALTLASLAVGDLTVQSSGPLQLGTGTVGGTLKAVSGGAAITQAAGGLTVGGSTTLDAGSASVQLADAANAFTGPISLNAGNATLASSTALTLGSFTTRDLSLSAGGDLDLGTGSASGNLTASTRGSRISQTGVLTVQGSSTFIADGSLVDLVLDQPANQLLGPIQMLGVNGGSFISANFSSALDLSFTGDVQTLTLASGGKLTLGGGHSTTLTAAARNGIVQTGALDVSGATTLIARGGAAMPVALDHAGNDFRDVTLRAEAGGSFGRVQLRDGDTSRRDGLRIGGDAAALELASAGALDLAGGRYGSLVADTSATGAAISQSGALTVTGAATLKAGGGSITLDRADNRFAQIGVGAGTASLVSAGDYTFTASSVATWLELGGPGAITLAGPLSGAGELLMSGTGSLTIASAQGYAGGTRIASGRLVLEGPQAQAGSGAVQLGAAGELDLRDGATLGAELVAQGGNILNTAGAGTLAGPVTLQATTSFLPGAGGLTVRGAISDAGAGFGLRLASAGTLTLTGSNHYSGATDIAAGRLNADGPGALPATSAVRLAAGATLALGADQTVGSLAGAGRVALDRFTLATGADGSDTAFAGSLDGSGGLTKLGGGRFTLAGTGSHTGATRVEAGELVLASATALNDSTAATVDAGALLTVQQSASLGSLAGAGTVDVQAALLAVGANGGSTRWDGSITGPGGLTKRGAGTFTLAGHNTLAGDLQVSAGTLALEGSGTVRPLALSAAGAATGPVVPTTAAVDVAAGATLGLLTDINLGALSGAGQVQLGASSLTLGASGRSSRFDGVISGSGALTKAGIGTLTLGGTNRFTGATVVDDGALVLDVAQALNSASALAIHAPGRVQANAAQTVASLNGTGALVLNGASLASGGDGSDSRFDGAVSGSGSLVKQGAGTLTLTAANSHAGGTVIEAGTVQLTGQGSLGSGDIRNDGQLRLSRSDALTLAQALSGRGSLVVTQGQVTLDNAGNRYTGATQVLGGSLVTTAAERLPDASAVQVAAGAQLQLGGNETVASLQAAGSVRLAGNLTTQAEQVYTGSLTLANPAGITLAGTLIDASRSSNQFGGTPLGLSGGQALVTAKEALRLGDVSLSNGGRIEAERLALDGKLQLSGGSLALVATAAPDDAKATLLGTAQVPVSGQPLAIAEATVQQGAASAITLAEGASLQITASGGGSVLLGQDANNFKGQLAVLSGAAYNTAWVPNAKGAQSIQSQVRVAGQQVLVGGSGIEADLVSVRADQLATAGSAALVARLPFDEIVLGRALSAPSMTLELAPGAFGLPGSFGSVTGQPIQVVVGSTETGGRTTGPNAGYLTVLPKAGAQGATAVVLAGPKVGSVPASGGAGYRFFHDGASQPTEIPVVYNGVLPLTPAASGAISSINGDAEDARRARFQETVRTENVTVRLRSGVIAEVGPGRASTQGSEGAKPPELCDPAEKPALSCKPSTLTP